MFRLFLRIPRGLDPVADAFKRHVENEGSSLVKDVTEAAKEKKEAGMCEFLAILQQLIWIVQNFTGGLKQSCQLSRQRLFRFFIQISPHLIRAFFQRFDCWPLPCKVCNLEHLAACAIGIGTEGPRISSSIQSCLCIDCFRHMALALFASACKSSFANQ